MFNFSESECCEKRETKKVQITLCIKTTQIGGTVKYIFAHFADIAAKTNTICNIALLRII